MSTNDLILLSLLSSRNELTLSKIMKKFTQLEIDKVPTRTGIYNRLNIRSVRNLISPSWKEGQKLYKSYDLGKAVVKRFKTNLNQIN